MFNLQHGSLHNLCIIKWRLHISQINNFMTILLALYA